MPYIKDEGGLTNNFAPETKTYQAEPPTKTQQRNYLIMGVAAMVLVGGLLYVATLASSVS
jgi:hypothetical protein